MNKPCSSTKLVSFRIDNDLYDYVRSKNMNLSFTLNALLRGYLYIQKSVSDTPIIGSSGFNLNDLKIDVYSESAYLSDLNSIEL